MLSIYSYSVIKQVWHCVFILKCAFHACEVFLYVCLLFPPLKLTFALIMAKSGIQMDNSLQSAL